jgi:hypothetical protein
MNQIQLIKSVEETYKKGVALIKAKNPDYADVDRDAFKNFRFASLVGVGPKRAILVRISDKLARISNLIDRVGTEKVKNEKIEDTLLDLINYSAILLAMIQDERCTL